MKTVSHILKLSHYIMAVQMFTFKIVKQLET